MEQQFQPIALRKRGPQIRRKGVLQQKWGQQYNQSKDECRWPTTKFGLPVKDCNFILEAYKVVTLADDFDVVLVKIPAGTKLYHATMIYEKGRHWFETKPPFNSERGMVWFTSTPEHTGPLNKTHILEYTVRSDLIMVFERNLEKHDGVRGYEYTKILRNIKTKLMPNSIFIDGYLGCNECEIAIFINHAKKN